MQAKVEMNHVPFSITEPWFDLLDAPRDPDAMCDAIAAGHVTCESRPIGWFKAAGVVADMMFSDHMMGPRRRLDSILAPARLPDLQ